MKTIVVLFNKTAAREEKKAALETISSFNGVKKAHAFFDKVDEGLSSIATVDLKKAADASLLAVVIGAVKNVDTAFVAPARRHG